MSFGRVVHRGWQVSPYTAKTRAYLKWKRVPFEDREPSFVELYSKVRPNIGGKVMMPTVEVLGRDGSTWLQDSSDIVDYFEAATVGAGAPSSAGGGDAGVRGSVFPAAPACRVASALLELFSDEWLPMAALHYRWNNPNAAHFARSEFSRSGIPWLPTPLHASVGAALMGLPARKLTGYLPVLGVRSDAARAAVEATMETTLAAMEATLAAPDGGQGMHGFLLGPAPCLGDFALYGPVWGHVFRDGGSPQLFDARPNLRKWMRRITDGEYIDGGDDSNTGSTGSTGNDGEPTAEGTTAATARLPPEALDPLFGLIMSDQLAWVATLEAAVQRFVALNPTAARLPRSLGSAPFSLRGVEGSRTLVTFVQYKAQRVARALEEAENAGGAEEVAAWLRRVCRAGAGAEPGVARDRLLALAEKPTARDMLPRFKHPIRREGFDFRFSSQ